MAASRGYSTRIKEPRYKTEKRIKMPQPAKRPLQFQTRTLIRHDLINRDPWWFVLHRRGLRRPKVGEDELEARAVPHSLVRGTLPERIIYKYLVEKLRYIPNVDFDFQSSVQGGRIDLGGIVADFLFPVLRIVINPLGPTHDEYIRMRKDDEQNLVLSEMGFDVYMIDEDTVYDEFALENFMTRNIALHQSGDQSIEHRTEDVWLDDWNPVISGVIFRHNQIENFINA